MTSLATGWIDTLILIMCAVWACGRWLPAFFPEKTFALVELTLPQYSPRRGFDTSQGNNMSMFGNHLLPRAGDRSFIVEM